MLRTYHDKWGRRKLAISSISLCVLIFPSAAALRQDVAPSIKASTPAEIAEDAAKVNCKDSTRINSVRELWQKMGAEPSEISVEKSGGTQNLVIRKKASIETAETIVLGAHYDKTIAGCGAIDNWTGIVAISHIFRTVKDMPLTKNLILVAFGNEEQGLLGSRAMIKAIPRDDLQHFCAMINVDSLGMTSPTAVTNLSSKPLSDATLEVARDSGIKAGTIDLPGAGADSLPFIEKNVPAVTIVGLDRQWRQILHTGFDQANRVKMPEVHEGYKLALNLLLKVEKMDCHSFAASRRDR